jgi:hypothetical protein
MKWRLLQGEAKRPRYVKKLLKTSEVSTNRRPALSAGEGFTTSEARSDLVTEYLIVLGSQYR